MSTQGKFSHTLISLKYAKVADLTNSCRRYEERDLFVQRRGPHIGQFDPQLAGEEQTGRVLRLLNPSPQRANLQRPHLSVRAC